MERKTVFLIFTLLFLISGLFSLSLATQSKESAIDEMFNLAQNKQESAQTESSKAESENTIEIPDWLKRISYGVNIETDQKPRIYIETVQPLYQSVDKINTFFTHDRVSIQNDRGTYSAGLGYRRLLFNENLLAGVNTFFDYQDLHQHYRQGLGLEAITKTLEFRTNAYFGISPKRLVEETGATKVYERAVNGGDIEVGGPIPYLPWLKLFGSGYHYDFREFKDMNGWKARGEIKPFKFITINLETYDDNKGEQEYRMDTRFTLAVDDFTPKSILSAFKLAKEPFPDVDLKERTLDRVERNFTIQVEKWSDNGNIVEIRRGS
ncbi:MAG: inverse autotransporter beta domain-containing protein [Candidatus Omnitrophica bacterium]|nr:inverse autotransporter beta domain-containing protein [Candidatus Omnitrophota bacterium]